MLYMFLHLWAQDVDEPFTILSPVLDLQLLSWQNFSRGIAGILEYLNAYWINIL